MASFYVLILLFACVIYVHPQKFEDESIYMRLRWLDINAIQWKPNTLDQLEKVLDSELKYADERKGVACKSIEFEQEAGYPKDDGRFLDTSIRGLCTDENNKVHNIPKEIITVAIERRIEEVNALMGGPIYSVGNVQFYKRNRNLLNYIVIPVSVAFTLLLCIFTFVIRRIRYGQKHRHIVAELQKKKDATAKKGQTVANPDPNASEKQRLLQLDPTVVGSASGTLGSPKEFTNETYPSSSRPNPLTGGFNRDQRDAPPSLPSKDNRAPYNNRDTSPTQRSGGNSRDRDQAPYENAPRFSPSQGQYPYDSQHPDMIPLQEQQPRVVVRTIREDPTPGSDYPQQYTEPSARFVPIPVQVERSGPQQRFAAPPYHSDPYYRHGNS